MGVTKRPDVVVGIDVGQTCSGVAYSIGPDWSDPRTINSWPALHGIERADKVATRVGYSKTKGSVENWGFEAVFGTEGINVRELFKLTLDAEYQDDRGFSCHDAGTWYLDYLHCLRKHVEGFFTAAIPRWKDMHVEYNFSTPTTWRNPAMIANIQGLIEKAGFASAERHSIRMSLTEAEAAAIEASTTRYRPGDVFLICDAGGGTTDVNLLKVVSTAPEIELEPLDHVEGVPIGSTLIDFRMAQHIISRLELIQEHLDRDMYSIVEEMLIGRFQTIKHSFPIPVVDQFWLDVGGLRGTQKTLPQAGIVNSKMAIERTVLAHIFDQQIEQIFSLVDRRLLALQETFPRDQVSYIILSGGLGSSLYLYDELSKRYQMNRGFSSANTASIQIMRVLEPQLAVVRGLVRERTQQLGVETKIGRDVFTTRRCRNSYGVLTRVAYDPAVHQGIKTVKNPHTGKVFVPNTIEWFIKQGQEVNVDDGIRQNYCSTIADGEHLNPRSAQIVMSALPPDRLPRFLFESGCQKVATVSYRLSETDMKLKRPLLRLKKKYWRAEVFLVIRLGPADLRFQILGKNGLLSSDQDNLTVDFADPYELP